MSMWRLLAVCVAAATVACSGSTDFVVSDAGPEGGDASFGVDAAAPPVGGADTGVSPAADAQGGDAHAPPADAAPCAPPLTACGGTCVDLQSSAEHCGACDKPCPPLITVCDRGKCEPAAQDCRQAEPGCPAGYYCSINDGKCYPGCATNEQCPANEHCVLATHSCTCNPGWHRCGGVCVADTSVKNCGTACTPCPEPPNASATCDGKQCSTVCDPGYTDCGGQCTVCPSGSGIAETGCQGTSCVVTACSAGYRACGTGCCPWVKTQIASDVTWLVPELAFAGDGTMAVAYSGEDGYSEQNVFSLSRSAGGSWTATPQAVLPWKMATISSLSLHSGLDGKPRIAVLGRQFAGSANLQLHSAVYEGGTWKALPLTSDAELRSAAVGGTAAGATCRLNIKEAGTGLYDKRQVIFDGCIGGTGGAASWSPSVVGNVGYEKTATLGMIVEPTGTIHASWIDTSGALVHASESDGSWPVEPVAGKGGGQPSLAFGPTGALAMGFMGSQPAGPSLAVRGAGGTWTSQVVDPTGGGPVRLAYDSQGRALIGHRYQVGSGYPFDGGIALRRQSAGGSFDASAEKVPAASANFSFALDIDGQDKVHLVVADDNDKLYHIH